MEYIGIQKKNGGVVEALSLIHILFSKVPAGWESPARAYASGRVPGCGVEDPDVYKRQVQCFSALKCEIFCVFFQQLAESFSAFSAGRLKAPANALRQCAAPSWCKIQLYRCV